MILEPHPSTPSTKTNYSNDDTFFSGTNFIFVSIKDITDNVYPCDTYYEPMYNVPIVTGASTYKNRNIGRLFIIVINEALYYGKKLDHYFY